MDSQLLKKVILPKGLVVLQANVFNNTPALQEVNFDQLTNLTTMGTNNFTTLQNFKSSSITATPSTPEESARHQKATKEETEVTPTLDLSNTKLTALPANSFTNLPSAMTEVKLPSTITNNSFVGTNTLTQVVDATETTPAAIKKFPLTGVKFIAANGEDQTTSKFAGFMTINSGAATTNVNFYTNPNTDLTFLTTLTTLSPSTFALNKDLQTLKLPAKATT